MDERSDPIGESGAAGPAPALKDYYSILAVAKNASAKEVSEAYFRLRNAFSPNSQALYSLMGQEDVQASISEITEAYQVLGHSQSRMKYDRALIAAKLATHDELRATGESPDEGTRLRVVRREYQPAPCAGTPTDGLDGNGHVPVAEAKERAALIHPSNARRMRAENALNPAIIEECEELRASGDPADGLLFRALRETVGVSEDELQEHIKVSIGYIRNIEENAFDLLPQPVYVKGFLKSYFKYLGIADAEPLVAAYNERYAQWLEEKDR